MNVQPYEPVDHWGRPLLNTGPRRHPVGLSGTESLRQGCSGATFKGVPSRPSRHTSTLPSLLPSLGPDLNVSFAMSDTETHFTLRSSDTPGGPRVYGVTLTTGPRRIRDLGFEALVLSESPSFSVGRCTDIRSKSVQGFLDPLDLTRLEEFPT